MLVDVCAAIQSFLFEPASQISINLKPLTKMLVISTWQTFTRQLLFKDSAGKTCVLLCLPCQIAWSLPLFKNLFLDLQTNTNFPNQISMKLFIHSLNTSFCAYSQLKTALTPNFLRKIPVNWAFVCFAVRLNINEVCTCSSCKLQTLMKLRSKITSWVQFPIPNSSATKLPFAQYAILKEFINPHSSLVAYNNVSL